MPAEAHHGKVYLVGAGPGDAELISVKGMRLLREADAVVFDALANPALLSHVRGECELIDAGKRAKAHKLTQEETNALLAQLARDGKKVVRLKGGDPYVFGRGSEEAMYLREHGIAVEVVPGITAAIAAPAYAGIPVTHRQVATTVTFVTGHEDPTKSQSQVDYEGLARLIRAGGTACFYMGMGRLQSIVDELERFGVTTQTPAAVVQWGTMPTQRTVRAALKDLPSEVERTKLGAPAIIVIGPVAAVDPQGALRWFEQRPLHGQTILITRTRHQASDLRQKLEERGANVLEAPTIDIVPPPPEDLARIDDAIRNIGGYQWLILTSINGVTGLRQRLDALGLDARHLAGVKVAAIGDATAAGLREMGIRADLVPTQFVAESLAAELMAREPMAGKRVLMLRADIARPALREKLTEAGATVEDLSIYETRPAAGLPEDVIEVLDAGKVDWITFTSSSTARNLVDLLGDRRDLLTRVKLASIGPITSQTLRELNLPIAAEAKTYNIDGLIKAIEEAAK